MAYSGQDLIAALQAYHPDVNLSNTALMDLANQQAGYGMSPQDFAAKWINDPAISNAYYQKYNSLAAPGMAQIQKQIGLTGAQYENARNQANNDFANTSFGIQQNQNNQNQSLFNQADAMGLGRSGVTAAGTGRIAAQSSQNLSYADAQRANSLAQLALENQGTQDTLKGQIAAIQAGVTSDATKSFNQNSDAYFQRQKDAFAQLQNVNPTLAASSPSYRNLLNTILQKAGLGALDPNELGAYFGGQVGNAMGGGGGGSTPKTTTPVKKTTPAPKAPINQSSLINDLIGYFQKGGWQGQDAGDIKHLQDQYGLSAADASHQYYSIRKWVTGK